MRIWIDVENPPQVQYQLPFKAAFEELGADVVVTARDHDTTLELLDERGVPYRAIGRASRRKRLSALGRTAGLLRHVGPRRPDALIAGSRAAALAAGVLRIPGFTFCDYEFVHLGVFARVGTYVLYPDAIDPAAFTEHGLRPGQLIPFGGLKENITFAGLDLDAVPAHGFPELGDRSLARVLFRPPAEDSHYYDERSGRVTRDLLGFLADRSDTTVIFSPRHAHQPAYLEAHEWRNPPTVLRRPVPFLSLLKSVDLVVCSGGTMLREAAYLGVPAYSIFQSRVGDVDRHLEAIGRVRLLRGAEDFDSIDLRAPRRPPLADNPLLLEQVVESVLERVTRR